MVIQNAYRNAARFLTRGIDTDAFHLAVESIERAGPHGNFLTDDLTLALLHKNQFFQDDIFDYSGGYRDGQSMLRRAHDRVEQLISGFVSPVPEDVQERLRRYFHDRYAGK
jgi:trimethylamine:corrinoid methyltransferase-like protein